ncbi:MAG: formate dehydrogenase subunit alpha [Chloroflexota bacterium]|nr:formate dehydrogenase subunit alpha [Chloroflexota bacterium]
MNLRIDGVTLTAEPGTMLLTVARAAGVEIPTLCHYEGLDGSGNCRLCTVWRADGEGALLAACRSPAEEGMEIATQAEPARAVRRGVLGDLAAVDLSRTPELLDLLAEYGVEAEVEGAERTRQAEPVVDNPFYVRDYEKCVLCWRCTDVCGEAVQQTFAITPVGRGAESTIGTYGGIGMAESSCVFCGNCVQVCPTGALEPRALWELGDAELAAEERVVETTCGYCGVGCGLEVHLRGDTITHVTSDPDGPVNQGWLCVKGRYGFEFADAKDRLTAPLVRDGDGWKEVSWDAALGLVAARLGEIKAESGPDALGMFGSSKCLNEDNYQLQKFARAVLGTNNVDNCARLCHSSSVAALGMSIGAGAFTNSLDEIAENDLIWVTGSNTTETHPITALKIKAAVRAGAKLIVADPRRIELTEFADLHLQPRTGTDVPLYNALLHCLIRDGAVDDDFIARRVEGFEEVKTVAERHPPEYAAGITGIPAEQIERAARMLGAAPKTGFYWGLGLTEHTHGTEACLAIVNLALATGNVGRRGTGLNPLRGQNNVQGTSDMGALPNVFPGYRAVGDDAVRELFEKAWGVGLPAEPGLTSTDMVVGSGRGGLRALYVMGENPLLSDPHLNHTRKVFEKLEFLVVQDIFMTETAAVADVVLPATSWAEKDGTYTNTDRRVQRVRPLRSAPGLARADWEILADLAGRMGYRMEGDAAAIFAEMAGLTPDFAGMSHARLDAAGGLRWPCPMPAHPGTEWLWGERFPTESGRGRMHPVDYRTETEPPDTEYPLIFNTGRVLYHWHTGSMTRRVEGLEELYPEALLEISPGDAEELGIARGAPVRVSSRRGALECRAWITKRVSPGTVYMSWHFAEAAANLLTIDALDPVSRIPEYKICACRVELLDGAVEPNGASLRSARA